MRKQRLRIGFGLIIILVLLIGGYVVMKQKNTPDTPAYNDEFTRKFLPKDVETPKGFHLFESGTKNYSILIPENYIIAGDSYYRKKGIGSEFPDTENVYLDQEGISPKENGMIKGIKLFLKPDGNSVVDASLDILLEDIHAPEDTEIQQMKNNNRTVYYAENVDNYNADDGTRDTYFYLYGFITDNHSSQALYFELEHTCFDIDAMQCKIDFQKEKEMGLVMMESVQFK